MTFDTAFGELAVHLGGLADYGIILLRVSVGPLGRGNAAIVARIGAPDDWAGHRAVREPERTQMRRLRPGRP